MTGVDFAVIPSACVHKWFQTHFACLLSLTGCARRFQLSLPITGRSRKAVKEHRCGGFSLFTPTTSLCAFRADRTPHFVDAERIPHLGGLGFMRPFAAYEAQLAITFHGTAPLRINKKEEFFLITYILYHNFFKKSIEVNQ